MIRRYLPDAVLHRVRAFVGGHHVDEGFPGEGHEDLAALGQRVAFFKFIRDVSACPDPRKGGIHVEIEDEEQIRLRSEFFVLPPDFGGIEAAHPLIGHRGEIVAVEDDHLARSQCRRDEFLHMLAAVLQEEIKLVLRGKSSGGGRGTDLAAPGTIGGFTAGDDLAALGAEPFGKQAALGRFAGAVDAFEDDEEALLVHQEGAGRFQTRKDRARFKGRKATAGAVAALEAGLPRKWRDRGLKPDRKQASFSFSNVFAFFPMTLHLRQFLYPLVLLLISRGPVFAEEAKPKTNILLICVDDLKPVLGCYGDKLAKTPNIDRLAARGVRFDMAYCNQSVCGPSRNNLLLGSRSTSLGIYDLSQNFRKAVPDAVTLPQYFMKHGYRAEAVGKILHTGHGNTDDAASWSVPTITEKVVEYLDPASTAGGQLTREEAYFTNQKLGKINSLPKGSAWETMDVPDEAYSDGRIAAESIKRLRAAKERGTPFFLGVGFVKPHLPFTAPKKYWDMHDPAKFVLASNPKPPEGAPPYAGKKGGEITNYTPVPDSGKVDDEVARHLIHGYYAATSFSDAQVGRVIDELDRLGLADSTVIVLWGDHGWHLGDHGIWTKHTNYEEANHIPLLIIAPGVTRPGSTKQLAETVDIYPTLAELAGLPKPEVPQPIDGLSLVPVLKDPAARIRDHAYHCFPRGERMGRAIRTERYRMVEWKKPGDPADSADIELYDYQTDNAETKNLAGENPDVVKQLREILARHPEAETKPLARKGK